MINYVLFAIILFIINFIFSFIVFIILNDKFKSISDDKEITKKIERELNDIMIEINKTTERNVLVVEDRINKLKDIINQSSKMMELLQETKEFKKENKDNYLLKLINEKNLENNNYQLNISKDYKEDKTEYKTKELEIEIENNIENHDIEDFKYKEKDDKIIDNKVDKKNIRKEVIRLYKQDMNPKAISKNLNISVSEVDTIISLLNNWK